MTARPRGDAAGDGSPATAAVTIEFFPIVWLALVAGISMALGLFLLFIPGLILSTIWFVGLPACVAERLGPWTSLRRSWVLTKGHRWKLFGLTLLIFIPIIGIELGLPGSRGPIVGLIGAGALICRVIWGAFAAVVATVAYRDLRVVKEGVDIEQIAVVFD